MREDYLSGEQEDLTPDEKEFDKALRPVIFDDFSGAGSIGSYDGDIVDHSFDDDTSERFVRCGVDETICFLPDRCNYCWHIKILLA